MFVISGITGVISTVGSAIFYFPPKRPEAVAHIPRSQLIKELDYLGPSDLFKLLMASLICTRFLPVQCWSRRLARRLVPGR